MRPGLCGILDRSLGMETLLKRRLFTRRPLLIELPHSYEPDALPVLSLPRAVPAAKVACVQTVGNRHNAGFHP